MSKYRFEIGGLPYTTKKAVEDKWRAIRDSYADDVPLSADDLRWMVDLLGYHSQRDRKLGVGILKIWVQQHPEFPTTRGFWLERIDGTKDDFSIKECVTASTAFSKFKAGAREAIKNATILFRELEILKAESPVCPFRKVLLAADNCHVDHIPPDTFEALLNRFMEAKQITADSVTPLVGESDTGRDILLEPIRSEWLAFHESHAKLRLVSATANLSDVRMDR